MNPKKSWKISSKNWKKNILEYAPN